MPRRPRKSLLIAYLLWLTLGVFGAHRFYLGKWFTGLIYAISFGFYFFGWALDGLLLFFMVRNYNARMEEKEEEERVQERRRATLEGKAWPEAAPAPAALPMLTEEVPEEETATWAQDRGVRPLEFLLRLTFFLVAPAIFAIVVLMLEQWELLVMMLATLVVCGFLGDAEALLRRYPMLEKVPLLGQVLHYLHHISQYYRKHPSFHFIYYLLYPATLPLAAIFSQQAREEFKVYGRLIGGLMMVVIARFGFGYFDIFPPHLGLKEAFVFLFTYCTMLLLVTTLFLIPTVSSALTLNAMKRQGQLRFFIFVGSISGLPMGLGYHFTQRSAVSFVDYDLLRQRLGTDSFRQELREEGTMFLHYWQTELDKMVEPKKDQKNYGAWERLWQDRQLLDDKLVGLEELTRRWKRRMGGLVPKREAEAFGIMGWKKSGQRPGLILTIRSDRADAAPNALLILAPDGRLYDRWRDLPEPVQKYLMVDTENIFGSPLRSKTLLEDKKGPW